MNLAKPLALVLFAAAGASALAQNLVRDGGFESSGSGGYNDGEPLGDGPWTAVGFRTIVEQSDDAISGNASLVLFYAETGATQTLATVAGGRYTVSFDAYSTYDPTDLQACFGSTTLSVVSPGTYKQPAHFSFDASASGASTSLSVFSPNGGLTYIDNFSVVPSAVPEPSALAALALPALALLRRRRAGA